jgi:hypothetical protein
MRGSRAREQRKRQPLHAQRRRPLSERSASGRWEKSGSVLFASDTVPASFDSRMT